MRTLSITLLLLGLASSQAFAVSREVRRACRGDYYAFCSQHAVGSSSLRACMRSHRRKLSRGCLVAIKRSGEASREEIARYKRGD